MTECYQDFTIYFHKSSKEARDDFLKYYLDNIDQFPDFNTDAINVENPKPDQKEQKSFKIFDYKNYSNDHNSSIGLIKPQFSFLFPTYRLTTMIDLTQSMLWTTYDGDVKLEKGLEIFKDILYRTIQSQNIYTPNIIVNIFCFKNSKLILIIKGWELQTDNVESFYKLIIHEIYKHISPELDKSCDNIINIIKEGIISLNLFENDNKSFSNLLIITDANYPIPDGVLLDKLMTLLRFCSVSCSFVHVKSDNDLTKFSSITDQGNDDQLKFIANASSGFYTNSKDFRLSSNKHILSYYCFYQSEFVYPDSIILKHFNEKTVNIPPLILILSLINSGYFISSINILRDSRCEIELQLPWKTDVYFRATIVSKLPFDQLKKCTFTLSVCANSYFLHCISKTTSNHDSVDLQRFHAFLTEMRMNLFYMDSFSQFNTKPICTIPNFINSGLKPMLSPNNQPCDKIDKIPKTFFNFWKRTLDLEYLICVHTTKINLLLEHDYPFPPFLSSPDPLSNRYSSIQCREGLVQLSTLINKNFCSFIVKENSTFVKFFKIADKPSEPSSPNYFCVIKLSIRQFEATLVLHFFIETPEQVRDEFVTSLRLSIANLKFPPRGKQARPRHMSSQTTKKMVHVPPQQRSWEQINCCLVLNLDLDNLMATYNPIKSVDTANKRVVRLNAMSPSMIYLHHQCYHDYKIWSVNRTFVSNIFETLIKIRLQEGFHFASSDSSSGFINLVREVKLLNNTNRIYHCFIQYMLYLDYGAGNRSHRNSDSVSTPDDPYGISDKFSSCASDTVKIFTEILIEKKDGTVTNCEPEVEHWSGKKYHEIPKEIIDIDLKCLETFVTFECFQIYPATLPRSLLKPNICSVVSNSTRFALNCPLFDAESSENFQSINTVFFEIFDRNLKLHGFNHIDITKTENKNFNSLVEQYDNCPYGRDADVKIVWYCYYTMRTEYLIVLMLPSNFLDLPHDTATRNLQLLVYGMSLKHLSFLIEDRWTLKLPDNQQIKLPLTNDCKDLSLHQQTRSDLDRSNEFAKEIDQIQSYLIDSVKKLDAIYVLTFVAGVHKNLRDNRLLTYENLQTVFSNYCAELSYYEVDATQFMNTICSHCFSALQTNHVQSHQTLALISKDNCEIKSGMHNRVVKRIRLMMAKYFKEIPSFPQILIYCPENEIETMAEFSEQIENEMLANFNDDSVTFASLQRQLSQDYQAVENIDTMNFTDNVSELDGKSISSIAIDNQNNCCPLFIMINYTVKYDDKQIYVNFDTVPTCISDFIAHIKSLSDADINFAKLKFNLDMIPITVIDEDLNNDIIKPKTDNYSLIVESKLSLRKKTSDITKKYLSTFQTQLLNNCRNELLWTLEDEIVNCLKYLTPIDIETVDFVMKHIDSTEQHKWHKSYTSQVRKKLFNLEFVFGFEKSKNLFQKRFENMTFGKYDQYKLEKIGNSYCVFQKMRIADEHSTLGLGLFPDQTITDMDDVFIQSRIRYETMCYSSLNRTSDNSDDTPIRRWSSDPKLYNRKYSRKMSSEPPERQNFPLFNINNKTNMPNNVDLIKPITTTITQYNMTRQTRSPMPCPINQQSMSHTPRRHRSGEASSTLFTGNCRSDTPLFPNGVISTATSSKGYEGDSSRVSDGEEYDMIDQFSNSAVNNKIDDTKIEMAPFWLLLNIMDTEKQIYAYFHHTDNCWLSSASNYNSQVCDHCNSFESIFEKINECVHQVNQCLLLDQLAQTRICRDILVAEDNTDQRISSMSHLLDYDYDEESTDLTKKFSLGEFACPKILKIIFRLHSRLRGASDKNTKAIPLLRSGLENIAVLNRKNMLIFVDDNTKGIFYSMMREITENLEQDEIDRLNENSVIISYSNNQLSKTLRAEEMNQQKFSENLDTLSIKSAPAFSELKSTYKPIINQINQSKNIELLELSVYGVDKLSEATISSIISNIGSKLDLIVLRKLSESICRSRAIVLNKEDIDFLLSDDFKNTPQKPKTFSWSLPRLVIENRLAFCYYLKQNLQIGFISPKIYDQTLLDRFSFNSENLGEIYLYNQTSAQGIPNEVIALFTLQLLSGSFNTSCVIKESSLPEFQLNDDNSLEDVMKTNCVIEIDNIKNYSVESNECYLNLNLWLRGEVDVDFIKKKILSAIQYSLNDLFMEFCVIPCPIASFDDELLAEIKSDSSRNSLEKSSELDLKIMAFENGERGKLNNLFANNLFAWVPELAKNDCPLVKYRRVEMFSDFNVDFFINDLVESMSESINLNVFHKENGDWHPWCSRLPKSGKEYPGIRRSFIIIGRLEELWKRFVSKRYVSPADSEDVSLTNSQTSLSFSSSALGNSLNSSNSSQQANNIKELRKVRTLLKQPPYEYSLFNTITPSTSALLSSNNFNNGLPEFCHVRVSNSIVIPRQMLCIIKIHGCQVDSITYNLAKEIYDQLNNSIDNILKNHKARFQMLNSFIYQKLGLFYEGSSKSCLQTINVNIIKSLLCIPPVKTKSTNSTIGEFNRDRRPSGSPRSFSPSTQIPNKPTGNNQNKSYSSKNTATKTAPVNINLSRIYQDAYTIYQLSEIRKSDAINDVIYHHAVQFIHTYNLELKRRNLSKKIRQSISFLQPTGGFKQSEFSELECPLQQLDVFSCMKRACRIFHSVVCPILFIPNVRKNYLNSLSNKSSNSDNQSNESSNHDEWIHEMSRSILAHYADYVQKEHGFQFINPPRPNMSQNPGSHALFQKVSGSSGIHIMEVFVLKDCLCVRLNLLEIRRLNSCVTGLTSPVSFQHVQKSFVKEACKLCDLTHLVSFMYDVYVRMIAKSITYPEENKKSFNPISFLRDLVKIYGQPPLYSTSHLYLMPFPVPIDVIKPDSLFEFLQRHYEDYNFSINNNYVNQADTDSNSAFLYNISEEKYSSPTMNNPRKISPSSSSPLDMMTSTDTRIYYKYLDNVNEWDLTSIFCLTRSQQNSDTSFDLFIITLNRSNCFPRQNLVSIGNHSQKSSTFLASYMTILPHNSTDPANLLHSNPCPISLRRIDPYIIPSCIAWRTFGNQSIVPLQAPLFLTLRSAIEKYFKENNEKLSKAITDCHKDSLWHRMYQRSEIDSTKFSLTFEEFQDLINSGDIIDILELDSRLTDSMKIAASYLKELNDYMGVLSDDCYTVLYENSTSIYKEVKNIISSHLVLMSKKTKDGFLLLSKNYEANANLENYNVQLKAIFRAQDCRTRVPLQHKYFSSSLRDLTVMLAETAAFCIWRKLAVKPFNLSK